jgi:hypothetical protein
MILKQNKFYYYQLNTISKEEECVAQAAWLMYLFFNKKITYENLSYVLKG